MLKRQLVWFLFAPLFLNSQCWAQGMAEFGGTRASVTEMGAGIAGSVQAAAAGLGAGMAASVNKGRLANHSYAAVVRAQQVAAMQTKVAQQYMQVGCDLESKKQWAQAEQSFEYVLKVIACRDGIGSQKSVPILEHLVTVTQAQNKLDQAISFQKTVLAFEKAAPSADFSSVLNAQNNLSNLFVKKGDYISAEPVLRESVALCDSHPAVPVNKRRRAVISYAQVLRKLHKDAEADALETATLKEAEHSSESNVLPVSNVKLPLPSERANSTKAE